MSKLSKPFQFAKPVNHKVVRDLRLVTEHVGDLIIEGTAWCDPSVSILDVFERYTVDITSVKWNGVDVKNLLEAISQLDDIEEAAIQHGAKLFTLPQLSRKEEAA